MFINISESNIRAQKDVWSSRGCELVTSQTSRTTTTCACHHMTLFAVLMDSGGNKVSPKLVRIPQLSKKESQLVSVILQGNQVGN